MNRKTWLLGGLALLLGLSLAYAWWASPRQERVSTKPAVRSGALTKTPAPSEKAAASEPRVRLDILERPGASFSEPSRDIFRLTANVPLSSRPEFESESMVKAVSFSPQVFPPVQAGSAAAPAAARFAYLGGLEKDGVKKVFLGVNGEIFIVQVGESFGPAGEYQVEELTREKLVVRQDGRPVTLSLIDTSQQTASLSARTNRPSPGRDAPFAPGRSRMPVFPGPAEDEDEDGLEIVEEPSPEEPPPSPGLQPPDEPADPTMESMSTLQLRSTIQ
jgi:hypothetical protein